MHVIGAIVLLLTVAAAVGPAYLGGAQPREHSGAVLALLPSLCLGFLVLALFNAVAAAGGREVIPREQAIAFPVSTTTDHLGALLLAPLNIAWIAQAWTLLGATSYALGPDGSGPTRSRSCSGSWPPPRWRRWWAGSPRAYGAASTASSIFRVVVVVLSAVAVALVVTGNLTQRCSTGARPQLLVLTFDAQAGRWLPWTTGVLVLVLLASAPPCSVPCLPAGRCTGRCARSCGPTPAGAPRASAGAAPSGRAGHRARRRRRPITTSTSTPVVHDPVAGLGVEASTSSWAVGLRSSSVGEVAGHDERHGAGGEHERRRTRKIAMPCWPRRTPSASQPTTCAIAVEARIHSRIGSS